MPRNKPRIVLYAAALAFASFSGRQLHADDGAETQQQLRKLSEENRALQEQLRRQQELIESLTGKVNAIQEASSQRAREGEPAPSEAKEAGPASKTSGTFGFGKVNISGEGGVAFFNTGSEGIFPNAEFRVDEAKLFVEAPVWGDVYFFTELNLASRELDGLELRLGELYLDFENVSQLWNQDRMLNVRAGRFDIPFGEEYLARDAIDNPLISHSLSDLWGVDEGLELYGQVGGAYKSVWVPAPGYFTRKKRAPERWGFDPANRLHLSVSGMRTGDLDAQN